MTIGSPLTVLHIFSGDLWAGAEVMIFHLLSSLKSDSNMQVLALSLNEERLSSQLRNLGITTYVIPESENSFPKIIFTALRLFKGKTIDIIHSHGYKQNVLALLLAKVIPVKRLITTLHGMPEPFQDAKIGKTKDHLFTMLNFNILNRYFTYIVSVSVDMKKRLIHHHHFSPEKIRVIHNGVASPLSSRFLCDSASENFHIGTVCRLVPVKDLGLFLEVAACIKKLVDKVDFSILGEGPLREQLMSKAKELQIENSVQFLPSQPDPFPYYRSLQIFLNTSVHEGVPLSILEAMACGLPIVAPRVGGIPEIIEHGKQGFLVEGRTPEKFSYSCLELLRRKDLRKQMGSSAAERFVNQFSSSRMAASYLDLYRESCSS